MGFPSTGHIQAVKTDFGQCPVCEDTSCAPGRYHGKFFSSSCETIGDGLRAASLGLALLATVGASFLL